MKPTTRRILHALARQLDAGLRVVITHPWSVLVVLGSITIILGTFALDLRIDSSVGTLIDRTHADNAYYQEIRRDFGSEEIDVVAVVTDDIFNPETLAMIATLSDQLRRLPGVARVTSLATVQRLELTTDGAIDLVPLMGELPIGPDEMARFRAAVYDHPLLLHNLVAGDGSAAAIVVEYVPTSDAEFALSGTHKAVERIVAEADGPERLHLIGIPTLKVKSADFMRGDLLRFSPLSVLVIASVLLVTFRTMRGVLLPIVTTSMGVVWTVGLMAYFDVPIDIGTLVLPSLLMAVGNAYATHVVFRYYDEVGNGGDVTDIVFRSARHLGVPVVVTALTTAIGFASLALYPVSAIRNLGVFAVVGIGALFVLALSFTTVALVLLPVRARPQPSRRRAMLLVAALDRLGRFDAKHRAGVLIGAAVVLGAFALGIPRIKVDTTYIHHFPVGSAVYEANRVLSDHLAGSQTFFVVVEGTDPGSATRVDTLQWVAALQDELRTMPKVDTTRSIVDYLALVYPLFRSDEANDARVPDTAAGVEQCLFLLEPETVDEFVSVDRDRTVIRVRSDLHSSSEITAALDSINDFVTRNVPPGIRVRITGTGMLLDRTSRELTQGQVQSIMAALVTVFASLSVVFLSMRVGMVAMVPNLVPIVMFFGVLGWAEIPLSLSTAIIASISLGIGVDEAVHLLWEFNQNVKRRMRREDAIRAALMTVGPPIVYSTVAIFLGLLVPVFSNFVPIRQFGYLSALCVAPSLVGDLLILPALLATRPSKGRTVRPVVLGRSGETAALRSR